MKDFMKLPVVPGLVSQKDALNILSKFKTSFEDTIENHISNDQMRHLRMMMDYYPCNTSIYNIVCELSKGNFRTVDIKKMRIDLKDWIKAQERIVSDKQLIHHLEEIGKLKDYEVNLSLAGTI